VETVTAPVTLHRESGRHTLQPNSIPAIYEEELHRESGRHTLQPNSIPAIYEEEPEEREAPATPTKLRSTKLAMVNEESFNLGALPPVSPRKWSFQRPSWPRLHVPAAYELDTLPPVSPQKWSFQRQKWSFQRPQAEVPPAHLPQTPPKESVDHALARSKRAPVHSTWCASSAVWLPFVVLVAACAIAATSRATISGSSWSWIEWALDRWAQWVEPDDGSVIFVPVPPARG